VSGARKSTKEVMAALMEARGRRSSFDALVDDLLDEFGGTQKLAEAVFRAYDEAKEGSLTQIRILETFMKMIMNQDARRNGGPEEPIDDLTEDELEALVREVTNGDIAGATEGEEPEGDSFEDSASGTAPRSSSPDED